MVVPVQLVDLLPVAVKHRVGLDRTGCETLVARTELSQNFLDIGLGGALVGLQNDADQVAGVVGEHTVQVDHEPNHMDVSKDAAAREIVRSPI